MGRIIDRVKTMLENHHRILLLPYEGCIENKKFLMAFMDRFRLQNFIIISLIPLEDVPIEVQQIVCKEEMDEILKLYYTYQFTDRISIGAWDIPYGRNLENLIKAELVTKEELIEAIVIKG